MALIKCKECGQTISDKAFACPHCGSPVSQVIKCVECGEPLPEYATECPICGCPTGASSYPSNSENTPKVTYSYVKDNGSSNKRKWLYGILALTVLALLVGLIYGTQSRRSNVPTEYCDELVKLAEEGNADAQVNLAKCYANGKGVEKSDEEANKWTAKAAEHGNADALTEMGNIYAMGLGVEENPVEAVKWYHKAAEKEHPIAMFNLAISYEYGRGIERNLQEAFKWFQLSMMRKKLLIGILKQRNKDWQELNQKWVFLTQWG